MSLPSSLAGQLRLPVIASPLFIISGMELVAAQCKAGIIGAFPALNARPKESLDEWLSALTQELARYQEAHPDVHVAPFAVNQIVHNTNVRLDHDVALCVKHRVPLLITSLSAPSDFVPDIHAYGGLVFHDVTSVRHAEKALQAGVDGLILVCAGAGGHAGTLSPIALVGEVRKFFDGPIVLGGAIASGSAILAAQAMGADLAYIGTRFIATQEANAGAEYKNMIVAGAAKDVINSALFTGVAGNYLRDSVVAAGLDPDNLPAGDKSSMSFGDGKFKPWKDIWGAGQGIGLIDHVPKVAELVAQLDDEYHAARRRLAI